MILILLQERLAWKFRRRKPLHTFYV